MKTKTWCVVSFTSAYIHIAMELVPCKFSHLVDVNFPPSLEHRPFIFPSLCLPLHDFLVPKDTTVSVDGVAVWQSFMKMFTYILICL